MKMQSTAVQKKDDSPIATVATVRGALEKLRPQFAMALPKHITADRLIRVSLTCIQNNPKLLECEITSLYSAIMTSAQLGLEPDGVLGHAYLIPFETSVKNAEGKWDKVMKVQFIPGYKGFLALARNSGEVISISAHEVCQNDEFDYEYGLNEKLQHRPADGNRGEIVYFYAYAKFKDGGHHFEVMGKEDVDNIRNKTPGYMSAKRYDKDSVWDTNYTEMGRKTVIRRIAKYLPLNVQRAAAIEEYASLGKNTQLTENGLVIEGAFEEKSSESKLSNLKKEAHVENVSTEEVIYNSDNADNEVDFVPDPNRNPNKIPMPRRGENNDQQDFDSYAAAVIQEIEHAPSAGWLQIFLKTNNTLLAVLTTHSSENSSLVNKAINIKQKEFAGK